LGENVVLAVVGGKLRVLGQGKRKSGPRAHGLLPVVLGGQKGMQAASGGRPATSGKAALLAKPPIVIYAFPNPPDMHKHGSASVPKQSLSPRLHILHCCLPL
jgi:hypothetical protein